jgi:hypothetical protein
MKECSGNENLKAEIKRGQQNQKALLDTLRIEKNRAGELQAEKLTLVASEKELKSLNGSLYAEIQKQKGQVTQLTQANVELSTTITGLQTELEEERNDIDTHTVYVDGATWPKSYRLKWSFDSTYSAGNYTKLSGFSRIRVLNDSTIVPGLTDITENVQGFKFTTGLTKKDGDYHIFVKSDHPGFSVSAIDGAVIPGNNPMFQGKPKKWGLAATVGPNFSYGYGTGGPGLYVGFGATIGLTYNIIKF